MIAPCIQPCIKSSIRPAIGIAGASVPSGPTIQSKTLAADGVSLTLVFSAAVSIGAGGSGGVSVKGESPADGSVNAVYSSGAGTNTLQFTLASTFYNTEDLRVTYIQPGDGFENGAGDDVSSFANSSVTNNSTVGDGVLRDENGDPIPDENGRAIPYDL